MDRADRDGGAARGAFVADLAAAVHVARRATRTARRCSRTSASRTCSPTQRSAIRRSRSPTSRARDPDLVLLPSEPYAFTDRHVARGRAARSRRAGRARRRPRPVLVGDSHAGRRRRDSRGSFVMATHGAGAAIDRPSSRATCPRSVVKTGPAVRESGRDRAAPGAAAVVAGRTKIVAVLPLEARRARDRRVTRAGVGRVSCWRCRGSSCARSRARDRGARRCRVLRSWSTSRSSSSATRAGSVRNRRSTRTRSCSTRVHASFARAVDEQYGR